MSTSNIVNGLIEWFQELQISGLENLDFKMTNSGLGCFAKKEFIEKEELFRFPRHSIISIRNVIGKY